MSAEEQHQLAENIYTEVRQRHPDVALPVCRSLATVSAANLAAIANARSLEATSTTKAKLLATGTL